MAASRRRDLLTPVLCLLAVLAVVGGVATESAADPAVSRDTNPTRGARTQVLSARRVPGLLGRPVADRRLVAALQPAVAALGGQSCVAVSGPAGRLFDHQAATALVPASNAKLLTGFAALRILGADTRFRTDVVGAAPDGVGTVAGDLWLVGGGDPLLSTAPFRARVKYGDRMAATPLEGIADAVVAAGVRHVTGSVVGDESRYDAQRAVPSWPGRYQAEGQIGSLSALAINDGRDFAAIDGQPSPGGPSAEPAVAAASALAELLRQRGVAVDGGAGSGKAAGGAKPIASVDSPTVGEIVAEMLTYSDNTTAELLTKEIGVRAAGKGTTAAGLDAIVGELRKAGLATEGLTLLDGSGLDRGDRVSCATLDALLDQSGAEGDLADGLPVAGTTGTLADRFRGSPAAGKVKAKTGSLRDVTSLSGWVTTDRGADLSFSIVVNTADRQVGVADLAATQRIAEAMLAYPDRPDPALLGPEPGP